MAGLGSRTVRGAGPTGTGVPIRPPGATRRRRVAQTGRVSMPESTLRSAATVVALVAACASSFLGATSGAWIDDYRPLLQLAAPLSLLVAWRLPAHRAMVLAIGIALVGARVDADGGAPVSVLGLAFLCVAADPRSRPWPALAGSVVGGVLGAGASGSPGTLFVDLGTAAIGGGAALLLRYWERTGELTSETRTLRGQAAWLEQRTALARELHDVVGHHVTAMVVQAEAGQLADPQRALERIGDLGRSALGELDRLVVHLRDAQHELTVSAPPRLTDIDELLAGPLRASGVRVEVRVDDHLGLDEAETLAVYRMAQEALTNVARHAGAQHAWVQLDRHGKGRVRLRVSDDGVGPPATSPHGCGLVGIAERAAAHGGTARLRPRPGGGTTLDVSIVVAR